MDVGGYAGGGCGLSTSTDGWEQMDGKQRVYSICTPTPVCSKKSVLVRSAPGVELLRKIQPALYSTLLYSLYVGLVECVAGRLVTHAGHERV